MPAARNASEIGKHILEVYGEAPEFMRKLVAITCLSIQPSEETMWEYIRALSHYSLEPEEWDQVLKALITQQREHGLPPFGVIHAAIEIIKETYPKYEPVIWRNTMRMGDDGAMGIGFTREDGSILRLKISADCALNLAETIQEFIGIQEEKSC